MSIPFDRRWLIPGILALCALGAMAGGRPAELLCRYDRSAILAGEWWRGITAHMVHLGWSHLLLNIAGIGLVFSLFRDSLSLRIWLIGVVGCAFAVTAGLLLFSPKIDWYVGMSGMLHGLFAMGLLAGGKDRRRLAYIGGIGLTGKLLLEFVNAPMPSTAHILDHPVVTESHLYGALGGAAIAAARYHWINFTTDR